MFGFICNKKEQAGGCTFGLTKKQQAIADREVELILLAKSLVQEQGFSNLTMDKLTALSLIQKGRSTIIFVAKKM
ncbi:transcriptional regulator TetR family [Vibrio ponticus]|nr:transcriptional regulator TetR family [Vibrio ponticus]